MRKAQVYRNGQLVGEVIQHHAKRYEFIYDDVYYVDKHCPAISLTMPKTQKLYKSDMLFPCLSRQPPLEYIYQYFPACFLNLHNQLRQPHYPSPVICDR